MLVREGRGRKAKFGPRVGASGPSPWISTKDAEQDDATQEEGAPVSRGVPSDPVVLWLGPQLIPKLALYSAIWLSRPIWSVIFSQAAAIASAVSCADPYCPFSPFTNSSSATE